MIERLRYEIESGPGYVEAWSEKRLPFEPKGWMKEFRDELRIAVSELRAQPGEGLYSTYVAEGRDFCDVENVLIYNVGTAAFRGAASNELAFERRFIPVSPAMVHHYRYELRPTPIILDGLSRRNRVATWKTDVVSPLNGSTKLSSLWWAIRRGAMSVTGAVEPNAPIGVELIVSCPTHVNLAGIVKVAVDASIVAFHSSGLGSALKEMAKRLGLQIGVAPSEVEGLLLDESNALFTRDPVVRARGEGSVHWNPADDTCIAGIVRYRPATEWGLEGSLYCLEPERAEF